MRRRHPSWSESHQPRFCGVFTREPQNPPAIRVTRTWTSLIHGKFHISRLIQSNSVSLLALKPFQQTVAGNWCLHLKSFSSDWLLYEEYLHFIDHTLIISCRSKVIVRSTSRSSYATSSVIILADDDYETNISRMDSTFQTHDEHIQTTYASHWPTWGPHSA